VVAEAVGHFGVSNNDTVWQKEAVFYDVGRTKERGKRDVMRI
jgi:hypothetical protein